MAKEFTSDNFDTETLASKTPVLVDFYSESCGPCKRLGPVIEELATENEENAKVGKLDVTQNMELAMKFGISAVPTILVFKGGEVVERLTGYREKNVLQDLLDKHISA